MPIFKPASPRLIKTEQHWRLAVQKPEVLDCVLDPLLLNRITLVLGSIWRLHAQSPVEVEPGDQEGVCHQLNFAAGGWGNVAKIDIADCAVLCDLLAGKFIRLPVIYRKNPTEAWDYLSRRLTAERLVWPIS